MNRSHQDFYSEVTLEDKEKMRKRILSGAAPRVRRRQPRWALVASAAAAACMMLALVALLLVGGQQTPLMPLTAGPDDPAPADVNWVYYPAGEQGLFRVSEDGLQMEKMEKAFDPAVTKGTNCVTDAIALGDWVYYTLGYSTAMQTNMSGEQHIAICRIKADGTEAPELLWESARDLSINFAIWEEEIYWAHNLGLSKMQPDGSEQTMLIAASGWKVDETPNGYMEGPFVVRDGWVYSVMNDKNGQSGIYRTATEGTDAEPEMLYTTSDGENIFLAVRNFGDNWLWFVTLRIEQWHFELQRLSTDSANFGERETLLSQVPEGDFSHDWLARDGRLYYTGPAKWDENTKLWSGKDLYEKRLDGPEEAPRAYGQFFNLRLIDDIVYYSAYEDGQNWLHRIGPDGSARPVGCLDGTPPEGTPEPKPMPSLDPSEPMLTPFPVDWTDELIDLLMVEDAALTHYREKFGDKPMLMYYTDGIQAIYDDNNNPNGALVDFWVVWSETECYCISIAIPGYTVWREYPDTLWQPLEELKALDFPIKKVF